MPVDRMAEPSKEMKFVARLCHQVAVRYETVAAFAVLIRSKELESTERSEVERAEWSEGEISGPPNVTKAKRGTVTERRNDNCCDAIKVLMKVSNYHS